MSPWTEARKLINPFVSETTESAYVLYIAITLIPAPSISKVISLRYKRTKPLSIMGFTTTLLIPKIKQFINKPEKPNIHNNLNNKQSINLSYKNQFHSNYKIDEHILKNLTPKNVLQPIPTKKVRLILYYNKFTTSKLIISNNTSPSTELLDRINVVYMFKCPRGDYVSKENSVYVGLTTTTLSRRLTMHLNDSSSIALHLKTQSIPKFKFQKILL